MASNNGNNSTDQSLTTAPVAKKNRTTSQEALVADAKRMYRDIDLNPTDGRVLRTRPDKAPLAAKQKVVPKCSAQKVRVHSSGLVSSNLNANNTTCSVAVDASTSGASDMDQYLSNAGNVDAAPAVTDESLEAGVVDVEIPDSFADDACVPDEVSFRGVVGVKPVSSGVLHEAELNTNMSNRKDPSASGSASRLAELNQSTDDAELPMSEGEIASIIPNSDDDNDAGNDVISDETSAVQSADRDEKVEDYC